MPVIVPSLARLNDSSEPIAKPFCAVAETVLALPYCLIPLRSSATGPGQPATPGVKSTLDGAAGLSMVPSGLNVTDESLSVIGAPSTATARLQSSVLFLVNV